MAQEISDELLKCDEIKDDVKRLNCFDMYIVKNKKNLEIKSNKQELSKANIDNLTSSFGVAHKYTNEEREFSEITATITSVKRNKRNKWIITLDNDQIWHEKRGDKHAKFIVGDEVIIKRGMMNGFKLKKLGTKRVINVMRVK